MKAISPLLSVGILVSCGNSEAPNELDDIERDPERSISNEAPRMLAPINVVEFLDTHDGAAFLDEDGLIELENINFDLMAERDTEITVTSEEPYEYTFNNIDQ